MRFAAFSHDGIERVGVVQGDALCALPPGRTLLELVSCGDLESAGAQALRDPARVLTLDEVELRAPIPHPPTIRDFMTFEQHIEGAIKLTGADARVPEQWYLAPSFYFTNPYAVHGPTQDVEMPPACSRFDFELEVAAVVGRAGRDIAVGDAGSYIAGYMLMNDWSARDLQLAEMQVGLGPVKGKDGATSFGPYFVTADELEPYRQGNAFGLSMTARVNGRTVGTDTWSNMAFSYPQMLSYASHGTWVRPGDVLGSGTSGGGCLAEIWGRDGIDAVPALAVGDVVELEVEILGRQRSRVVSSTSPHPDLAACAAHRRGSASGPAAVGQTRAEIPLGQELAPVRRSAPSSVTPT
jgi:2-keto-4-pentenoate hydratase/2-oxohepta-3-ene-1,7-dioic acid hydratase in catechol pathway